MSGGTEAEERGSERHERVLAMTYRRFLTFVSSAAETREADESELVSYWLRGEEFTVELHIGIY
ncbi:hypothetical protein EYF80_059859 [Liparis tanakae]|uniref:Uncharacterized protein n=1 Tax=Liparis tanakae TaxID=230148 RepID=A0A4Z2EN46_9TELE|nr:hypothetical protein EYF80_059859 [Liparis tanakae]